MSDVAVRFGYVEDEEGEREPAMGIYSTEHSSRSQFAIPLSSLYKYTDQPYLLRASFAIAQYLNMFPDQFLVNRIADTILNNIDTLVKYLPAEKEEGYAFGEGKVVVDGEVLGEFEALTNGDVIQ